MNFLPTVVLFVVVLASSAWVARDARALESEGTPVVLSLGGRLIGSPLLWTLGSLLLWVVCIPLYLSARRKVTR